MKTRKPSFVYIVVLAVLFFASIAMGILCMMYERRLEGLIIVGCAFIIFSLGLFLRVTQIASEKQYVYTKAGNSLVTMNGYLIRPDTLEQVCASIGLHENGVFIDYSASDYELISYDDITDVRRVDSLNLTFFVGSLRYEMMASSEIKRLAFESIFSMHCHVVSTPDVMDDIVMTDSKSEQEGDYTNANKS